MPTGTVSKEPAGSILLGSVPLTKDASTPRKVSAFGSKLPFLFQELLGGANDGCLYLYDRGLNSQTLCIEAHSDDVNAVSFVDENTHILASGGDDGLCKVRVPSVCDCLLVNTMTTDGYRYRHITCTRIYYAQTSTYLCRLHFIKLRLQLRLIL
jgi:hypothetical protein